MFQCKYPSKPRQPSFSASLLLLPVQTYEGWRNKVRYARGSWPSYERNKRMLLGAKGIATRGKDATNGAPGRTTKGTIGRYERNKSGGHCYERVKPQSCLWGAWTVPACGSDAFRDSFWLDKRLKKRTGHTEQKPGKLLLRAPGIATSNKKLGSWPYYERSKVRYERGFL